MCDIDRRRWLRGLAAITGCVLMVNINGCAMAETGDEKVYHGFSIRVGIGAPEARNIRYRYGDLGWRDAIVSAPPAGIETVRTPMVVPNDFEISWETPEGNHYEFKVPVRSKISSDIKGKTVLFEIMKDHVEGYLVTPLPNFQDKSERFY